MAWRDEHVTAPREKEQKPLYSLKDLIPDDLSDEVEDSIGYAEWDNPMAMEKKVREARKLERVGIYAPVNLQLEYGSTWCPDETYATCEQIIRYLEKARPDIVDIWLPHTYERSPGVYNCLLNAAVSQVPYRKLRVQIMGISPFNLANLLRTSKLGINAKDRVEVTIAGFLGRDKAEGLFEVLRKWKKVGVKLFHNEWDFTQSVPIKTYKK